MTAPDRFDLDEYVLLLQAIREGGYRFAGVDRSPDAGDEYMRQPLPDGTPNVMEERFARHYRSDSNQHWRQGSPREDLAAGRFEWLQLLTHPEIWVYDGETMRETMESMLDSLRGHWLEHLAGDRIDLS